MHCAMAKRVATDAGFHVCDEALQLLARERLRQHQRDLLKLPIDENP